MGNACCVTREKANLHVEVQPLPSPGLSLFGKQHINNSDRPLALLMKEKKCSCTGDDFKIKNALTQETVYTIEGRGCACGEPKILSTDRGEGIFVMKKDLCPAMCKQTHRVYLSQMKDINVTPDTEKVQIIRECACFGPCQQLIQCDTTDSSGRPVKLMLFADCCAFNAVVFWGDPKEGGLPVATVARKYGAKDFFLDKQNYLVTVAPGMDIAAAIAMAVAFDEGFNDNQDK
uniref:Phospholipid scramblase n=1 Tax=Chromera velia CCMP2878 TaxID=1169474 RepID=A0A0G4HPF7_9ALVE|eukprot:Cvel_29935.t1-p1 / transcript=Cvel_29935.t1 / gene=Cvel_29935 / organism=Chromera_velia_CCMP2878 / gene_product=hypothetical protein / transcript_product=hypothetical protein / location=Cvel_scaffold4190:6705-7397(-) / protein_length=231 / sequence_SO=supercontig / SO=protein_coding / is_pseudo=false